jgi:hypothetical protein
MDTILQSLPLDHIHQTLDKLLDCW